VLDAVPLKTIGHGAANDMHWASLGCSAEAVRPAVVDD
jgi:hypothetical protein